MLRFACLGSGSAGNALVVEASGGLVPTRILVDNGFSLRDLRRRLQRVGLEPDDLGAVFVTHEHGDHASGVMHFALHHHVPVFATAGTAAAAGLRDPQFDLHLLRGGEVVEIGMLAVRPFAVPHDADEPVQFVFSDGAARLGLLTDIGCSSPSVAAELRGVHALLLECNHDLDMLRTGPYPYSLKVRVGGGLGHLSNKEAAALLAQLDHASMRYVIAAHLSRRNNTPALARAALAAVLGCADRDILVADQEDGLGWMNV